MGTAPWPPATSDSVLEGGWHHVGWLLYPEGVGNYVVELAPGPHYLLAVRYCEITPID